MNIYDYITRDDLLQLTDEEYESFRNYLKFMGHRVSDEYGSRFSEAGQHVINCVMLYRDGDLGWADRDFVGMRGGNRIPLEEVKRMASLGFPNTK